MPRSQGWVLERPIPGRPGWRDAVGCYPLFACGEQSRLGEDLAELRTNGLVSLVLTTDPMTGPAGLDLERWFGAVARPWKDHYLVDMSVPLETAASKHHLRNARRFGRHAELTVVEDPSSLLDQWCRLYGELVARHRITGMARFSRDAFARQLALPGTVALTATAAGEEIPCAIQIWYTDGHRAWHHLSGYDRTGYRWGGASYALVAAALEHLRKLGVRETNLGSGAGLEHDPDDGLSRFKGGWSTHAKSSWLCGAVLDPVRYAELGDNRSSSYFPFYRDPSRTQVEEVVHAGQD
ncbi:MAG: GNAT family N-acetyltransferase [bacterium]|nr:GNAT family N-acetyltransferase [bacterium]